MSRVVSIAETGDETRALISSARSLSNPPSSLASLTTKWILSAVNTRRAKGHRLSSITTEETQRRVAPITASRSICPFPHRDRWDTRKLFDTLDPTRLRDLVNHRVHDGVLPS